MTWTLSAADVGELEPVGLLGVEPAEALVHLREAVAVRVESGDEFVGGSRDPTGSTQLLREGVDGSRDASQRDVGLHAEHLAGDLGCDVGVAVAVTTDPGAEPDGGDLRTEVHVEMAKLVVKPVEQSGDDLFVELLEVVQHSPRLVDGRGTFTTDLVRLPQQFHHLGEPAVHPQPVGLAGAGIVALCEHLGDLHQLGEDRTTGRLGGVCREDRADALLANDRVAEEVAEQPDAEAPSGLAFLR